MQASKLIQKLERSPDPKQRHSIVQYLGENMEPTEAVIDTLIQALNDQGSWEEKVQDWIGPPIPGNFYYVVDAAIQALSKIGILALPTLLHAVENAEIRNIGAVATIILSIPLDDLHSLDEEQQKILWTAQDEQLHAYLQLLQNEQALSPEDRLQGRLSSPFEQVQKRAIQSIKEGKHTRFAETLAQLLLQNANDLNFETMGLIGEALIELGPVLTAKTTSQLVEQCQANRLWNAWPTLFRALSEYEEPSPALFSLLQKWIIELHPPPSLSKDLLINIRNAAVYGFHNLYNANATIPQPFIDAFINSKPDYEGKKLCERIISVMSDDVHAFANVVLPALRANIQTDNLDHMKHYAEICIFLKEHAASAVSTLTEFVRAHPINANEWNSKTMMIYAVLKALIAIGKPAKSATATLQELPDGGEIGYWKKRALQSIQ